MGIRRHIGSSWGRGEYTRIPDALITAILFSLSISIPAASILFLVSIVGYPLLGLGQVELLFLALLFCLDSWPSILASLFISILKTQHVTVSNSVSSAAKLVVGLILLSNGFGLIGILVSIAIASAIRGVILVGYTIRTMSVLRLRTRLAASIEILRDILRAGVASWIPSTLLVIGQTMGIILIFGTVGPSATGLYFVAFAISTAVYNLSGSIQSLMFPVLSGMENGRVHAARDGIRLSLAFTSPIAILIATYSALPFTLLAPAYSGAANILFILVLGSLLYPITTGYCSFVYAKGAYMHVIAIDLTTTAGRLLLYFTLVPLYEGVGAATAFVFGIILSLIPVAGSIWKTGFKVEIAEYVRIIAIPALMAVALHFLAVPWPLGIPTMILASSFAFARMGIITRSELKDMALAFLSPTSVARVYRHTKRIVMLLFGD